MYDNDNDNIHNFFFISLVLESKKYNTNYLTYQQKNRFLPKDF